MRAPGTNLIGTFDWLSTAAFYARVGGADLDTAVYDCGQELAAARYELRQLEHYYAGHRAYDSGLQRERAHVAELQAAYAQLLDLYTVAQAEQAERVAS